MRREVGLRVCGVGGIIGSKGDELEMGSGFCCLRGEVLRDCLYFFVGVSAIGSFFRNVDNCFHQLQFVQFPCKPTEDLMALREEK